VIYNKAFGLGCNNRAFSREKQLDPMLHCFRLNGSIVLRHSSFYKSLFAFLEAGQEWT